MKFAFSWKTNETRARRRTRFVNSIWKDLLGVEEIVMLRFLSI